MRRSSFILLPLFSLGLIVEGCAVFNSVGNAISSGYENTLTYFNVYYNARSAFNDAEASIKAAAKAAEGKTAPGAPPAAIPPDASKDLDLVIDKCSNILAYHNKSSYVDDALMMTGKAFYYKAEYSKAERKFLELITQYPNSSLNLEAQLWYCKSQEKLNENEQARKNLTQLIASAEQDDKADILAEAFAIMGSMSAHDNATEPAIEWYQKSAKAASSDQLIADAWFHVGRLYFDDGQFQNSVDAFLKVEDHSDDVYQLFRSKLFVTQAYRKLRFLDKALTIENEMATDYRFKDYLGSVLLERATILLTGGRYADALDIFRALDTTYARTETGAMADFELGKYFEQSGNDYAKARDYYSRAMTVPATSVMDQSAHKVIALNLYFKDWKELTDADSLLALVSRANSNGSRADSLEALRKDTSVAFQDSIKSAKVVIRNPLSADTLKAIEAPRKDTSAALQDSVKPAKVVIRNLLSADSLNAIEARAAAGLGELFYTDLANPDSAIYWLRYSLLHQYVEHSAPRILYMLSELATSNPDKTTVTSKEFQDQLVRDFPNSYFAREIQHLPTNVDVSVQAADSAIAAYGSAEGLIDAGKNEEALAALKEIIARYPNSPVVAKCTYTMGWLYENRLAKMDSAAAEYKLLIAQYPTTPYAQAVNTRQLDTLATTPIKNDSLSKPILPPAQKKDSVEVGEARGLNVKQLMNKPPGSLSRRARILQSQQSKKTQRE